MQKTKFVTIPITVPVSGSAGSFIEDYTTEKDFDRLVGIYVPEQDSFAPPLRLGIQTKGQTYQDPTNIRDYVASTHLPHDKRLKEFDIRAKGNIIEFVVENTQAIATAITFDLVLKLENI
ncbi:MAG: hypothetical protein MRZ79_04745 [Bacteroidia bacterium]|nr:hypothetical protein [Bacteroidia bacterium]